MNTKKYNHLKSFSSESYTQSDKNFIAEYEKNNPVIEPKSKPKYSHKIILEPWTKASLMDKFLTEFERIEGVKFELSPQTAENINTLCLYFAKDETFLTQENISKISKPSLDKGLLIVGDYGCGKTTVMRVFEEIFKVKYPKLSFKCYSTLDIVSMYEKITNDYDREDFDLKTLRGVRCFDDIKTEGDASNYGKVNLMKDILEKRCNNKRLTYATCNYKENAPGDLEECIMEFKEKYGPRVFDRLFEMFNIIEFKGDSFRI